MTPSPDACGFDASFRNPAQAELIPSAHRIATAPLDLAHLFTVHRRSRFIGQARDNPAAGNVDDVAGRGIGILAVETERDPAWLLADFNAGNLFGGQAGRVEDVHPAVMRVADPQLFLVGS